jgi:hypothetical protein
MGSDKWGEIAASAQRDPTGLAHCLKVNARVFVSRNRKPNGPSAPFAGPENGRAIPGQKNVAGIPDSSETPLDLIKGDFDVAGSGHHTNNAFGE